MRPILPSEAREYLERWREAGEMQRALDRATPIEVRLRQLAALVADRESFGADPSRERDVLETRARWVRIRELLGG